MQRRWHRAPALPLGEEPTRPCGRGKGGLGRLQADRSVPGGLHRNAVRR